MIKMKMKKPNNRTIFNSYLAGLFEGDGRSYLTFERKYPKPHFVVVVVVVVV